MKQQTPIYKREQQLLSVRSHWLKKLAECEDRTESLWIAERLCQIDSDLLSYSEERRDSISWGLVS